MVRRALTLSGRSRQDEVSRVRAASLTEVRIQVFSESGGSIKMKLRQFSLAVVLLSFLYAGLSAPAQAGTVTGSTTIGQPALDYTGSCDPFGCPQFFGLGTYEQVYSSAAFPGAVTIQALSFFDTVIHNGGQPAGGTFTLDFGYTSMMPDNLSLNSASSNLASANQVFFTGSLPALSRGVLAFTGTPFSYNPDNGNLLLTVTVSNPSDKYIYLELDEAANVDQTTNAYFGTYGGHAYSGGNDYGGLVTKFTYTTDSNPGSVPEPGTLYSVFGGILVSGSVATLRRRARRS
jgi:hypothetical protein